MRCALDMVVAEAVRNFPRIVDHFPERMRYIDLADAPDADGLYPQKTGRVVLSGGESLLDSVRESVTYPVIERLQRRYATGSVEVVVQTTGDLLTDRIVGELLQRGTCRVLVASVDDFHVGLEGAGQTARLHGAFVRNVSAPRRASLRPGGDHAQLAEKAWAAVKLLRRHARFLDRQAVAARPRLAEQLAARHAVRQLLQPRSGGLNFLRHACNVQRLRSLGRARRQRLFPAA